MKKISLLFLSIFFICFITTAQAGNEIKKLSGVIISKGLDSTQYIEIYCIDGYKYIIGVSGYTVQVTQMTKSQTIIPGGTQIVPVECK